MIRMSPAKVVQSDSYFAHNLDAILARSESWQNFKKSGRVEIAVDTLEWYAPAKTPFSPLRKLALAVLAQAVYDAVSKRTMQSAKSGNHPAGVSAFDWLNHWGLVEPWCRAAEIPPSKLKRRIAALRAV